MVGELSFRRGEEQDAERWFRAEYEVPRHERLLCADICERRPEGVLEGNWTDSSQGDASLRRHICRVSCFGPTIETVEANFERRVELTMRAIN